jgi:CheY-like chemotaxis protein
VQVLERDGGALSDDARDMISTIRRNVELEARLIDDLLDLTRIARGKLELSMRSTDAHATLANVIRDCQSEIHSKQLQVATELGAKDHRVEADPVRLQQVLWNLMKNAIKFTPNGGDIAVRTADTPDGFLQIQIIDSGIGIEPHLLPRIFDAFEQGDKTITRHFGGLGLGLAISKALVDLQNGRLRADSAGHGAGATFTVEMKLTAAVDIVVAPHASAGSDGALVARADADGEPDRVQILLVEDHADTARTMAGLLKTIGYEVRTADSVAAALQAAQAEPFDLLISDIGLPDGSGLDLMRQLRARLSARGICLSGFGMDEDIARSLDAGFAEHLTKPVDLRGLEAVIRRVMRVGQ